MKSRKTSPPEQPIELLRRYRAKGIPLMPHQKERLRLASQQMSLIDKSHYVNPQENQSTNG